MVATTELETAKSRQQRDLAELRDQLHRANIASERDQALREKVFNEAKAEVISLNKKVKLKLPCDFQLIPLRECIISCK